MEFLTCEEVSQKTGFALATIWKWIRQKKLPAYRFGRSYKIKESDLNEFLKARKTC